MSYKTGDNMQVYLVGGAVRDELLGKPSADRDWVVVGSTPEELLALGYQQVGNEFPCYLHPETKEEYALARKETKTGRGHGGFHCEFGPDVTLEQDLERRDLTVNAIAKDETGRLIDPYGGVDDLNNKVLRHVSKAFSEDPLRVLRVARFTARYHGLGFKVHPGTQDLMRCLVKTGELESLTAERVWKEMSRALDEPKPSAFFLTLRACGALRALLPEVDALFGVPQPEKHHPEIDSGVHTMMVLDAAKSQFNSAIVNWAALLHDLGKGVTPKDQWPKHLRHEESGVPLVEAVCERYKVPNEYKAVAVLTAKHHLRCHRLLEMKPGSIMRLIEALDGIRRPERVRHFAEACEADARGRTGFEDRHYPNGELLVRCTQVAKTVDIKPLLDKGYEGLKLAEQIKQLRIREIADFMAAI